jgi:hypothetical protein
MENLGRILMVEDDPTDVELINPAPLETVRK